MTSQRGTNVEHRRSLRATCATGRRYYIEEFSGLLDRFSAAVTGSPEEPIDDHGRYGARLVIEADSPTQALDIAARETENAASQANLPNMPLVHAEVTEWDEFERRLDQPTYPGMIGVSELAELLGVNRQRASAVARSANFPKPAAELAAGPVWFEPTVRRFVQSWDRKPGRPRKINA